MKKVLLFVIIFVSLVAHTAFALPVCEADSASSPFPESLKGKEVHLLNDAEMDSIRAPMYPPKDGKERKMTASEWMLWRQACGPINRIAPVPVKK